MRRARAALPVALMAGVLAGGAALTAARAQEPVTGGAEGWQAVRAEGLTVLYRGGGEEARDLVLGRSLPASAALESAIGIRPEVPIVVRLHPDIDSFLLANPLATEVEGVIGGARHGRREVEIVVSEAMDAGPDGVDGAFRRELARLMILERSGGSMPDVFVDGLADEFSPKGDARAAGVARLREAWSRQGLPTWSALAAPDGAYLDPPVVRPMARSMAGFLLERGGLGAWLLAADRLAAGDPWREAFQGAFGAPANRLEEAWLQWLPSHLDGGWRRSVLYEPDVAGARAMLAAGDHDGVMRALRPTLPLVALDDPAAAGEIGQLVAASAAYADGARALAQASDALAAGDYDGAEEAARQATALLEDRSAGERALADEVLRRAAIGRGAEERLREAGTRSRWRVMEVRALAGSASADFALLGNDAAAAVAAELAADADRRLEPAGRALVAAGAALLVWNVRLRRRVGERTA